MGRFFARNRSPQERLIFPQRRVCPPKHNVQTRPSYQPQTQGSKTTTPQQKAARAATKNELDTLSMPPRTKAAPQEKKSSNESKKADSPENQAPAQQTRANQTPKSQNSAKQPPPPQSEQASTKQNEVNAVEDSKNETLRSAPCLAASLEAKARADSIEAKIKASSSVTASAENALRSYQNSTAFKRFLSTFVSNVPHRLPAAGVVTEATKIPLSEGGNRLIISPLDLTRPGVIATADPEHEEQVRAVVTALRGGTDKALGFFRRFTGPRANAVMVANAKDFLQSSLNNSNARLADIPRYAAAEATRRAQTKSGQGLFASSYERMERAARGGLGRRQFNKGLSEATSEAKQVGSQAVNQALSLVVERTRQYAYNGAAKVEKEAKGVGKDPTLVGFEVDFDNKRGNGVDYQVKTEEGKTYLLHHVGRNFENKHGSFFPPNEYGKFNVEILDKYESKEPRSLSRKDFYDIALRHNLYPTEEGEIIYLDPKQRTSAAQRLITERLGKAYAEKGNLSRAEVDRAISEAPKEVALKTAHDLGYQILEQNGAFIIRQGELKLAELRPRGDEAERYGALETVLQLKANSSPGSKALLSVLSGYARNHSLFLRQNQSGDIEFVLPDRRLNSKILAKPHDGPERSLGEQLQEALIPCAAYDQVAPVAIENALANTRVTGVNPIISPEAYEVFRSARDAGLSICVVEREGEGNRLCFTYAVVRQEVDANGEMVRSEVGQRVKINRFGTDYSSDNEYFAVRDKLLAEELKKHLAKN